MAKEIRTQGNWLVVGSAGERIAAFALRNHAEGFANLNWDRGYRVQDGSDDVGGVEDGGNYAKVTVTLEGEDGEPLRMTLREFLGAVFW